MSAVNRNHRWRWLTGGAVALSLLAFLLLIALLAWSGVRYFWPQPVTLFTVSNSQQQMLGEITSSQSISRQRLQASGAPLAENLPDQACDGA